MNLFQFPQDLKMIMCLGAHPDDIEIGAFATIRFLAERYPDSQFRFVVLSGSGERRDEAVSSATALLGDRVDVVVGPFNDRSLPYDDPSEVKRFVRSEIPSGGVDLVIAPQLDDRHQDHRFIAELATQLFRDQPILGYELLKYDGGLVPPNVYLPVSKHTARQKAESIRRYFPSQADHHWFTEDAFMGLMRVRGVEANAAQGYAEAFVSTKMVIG